MLSKTLCGSYRDVDNVITVNEMGNNIFKCYHLIIDLNMVEEDKIKVLFTKMSGMESASNRLFFHVTDKNRNYKATYLAQKRTFPINEENTRILIDLFGYQNIWMS